MRPLFYAIAVALLATLVVSLWVYRQGGEADRYMVQAEARLFAPLSEAPELDRIQASTAISLLERAREAGADSRRHTGLSRYATAIENLQKGDLIFAEAELRAARLELGWTPEIHVAAAEIARRRTDSAAAQQHVDEVLATNPEHPRALLLRADLALDGGDAEAALLDLEKLLQIAGSSSTVRNRMAIALELEGEFSAAEEQLELAIQSNRLNHDAWMNLGRIRRLRGDWSKAHEAFEQVLKIAPENPDAFLGRGLVRVELSGQTGAEQDFRRSAELAPNDAEPLLALGDLMRDSGRMDEALQTYREALAREEADAASWLKLGNALVLMGQAAQSVRAFEEALRRAPGLAPAHNGLGAALMEVGDLAQAQSALRRAADLDQRDPNPLFNLALLHERAGNRQEARLAWQRALGRAPESQLAQAHLERLGG